MCQLKKHLLYRKTPLFFFYTSVIIGYELELLIILFRARFFRLWFARSLRKEMQVVFQDPFGSLSPRMSVAKIIEEGLEIHKPAEKANFESEIIKALKEADLDPDVRHRYPHEFSGGQRQRIAIARALVLKPKLLILELIGSRKMI